jgi:hypothetical protein
MTTDAPTMEAPPEVTAPTTTETTTSPAPTATETTAPPAATQTPPATTASLIRDDGTFAENWHTQLGDEFAPHAAQLATFKDVKGLAKSLIHFRSQGPQYPGEGASHDEISRFHALAKVPAEGTAAAYGLAPLEGGNEADVAVLEKIAAVAHQHHLSGPGFQAVVAEFQKLQADAVADYQAQAEAQRKAAEDSLVAEWKGNTEANKSIVRHWTSKLAEQAGVGGDDPGVPELMNNPAFGRIMLQVAKLTSEDGVRTPAGLGDLRSPQERADAIMNGTDPQWGPKYTGGNHEDRAAAYREVVRLLKDASR